MHFEANKSCGRAIFDVNRGHETKSKVSTEDTYQMICVHAPPLRTSVTSKGRSGFCSRSCIVLKEALVQGQLHA